MAQLNELCNGDKRIQTENCRAHHILIPEIDIFLISTKKYINVVQVGIVTTSLLDAKLRSISLS